MCGGFSRVWYKFDYNEFCYQGILTLYTVRCKSIGEMAAILDFTLFNYRVLTDKNVKIFTKTTNGNFLTLILRYVSFTDIILLGTDKYRLRMYAVGY